MEVGAKMIASLPMWPDFSIRMVNGLCRDGKLYAYKRNQDVPFEPWVIPHESFAVYLWYNPVYANAFNHMDTTGLRGDIMDFINAVKSYSRKDETYTLTQLSYIFNIPKNQIAKWFGIPKVSYILRFGAIEVSTIAVVEYLEQHSEQLEALKDRHQMLLSSGGDMEQSVRHLLMLYAYYKSNGYLR